MPPPLPTDSSLDLSLCQHKVLGVGNLLCGLGLVIANVIAVVTSLATLQLLTLVVRGAIALGGVLLATAALCMLPSLVRYIGYPCNVSNPGRGRACKGKAKMSASRNSVPMIFGSLQESLAVGMHDLFDARA